MLFLCYISEHKEVNDYVNNHFPLLLPDVSHTVINTFGVETLHNRFGIKATLVPNVMDFDRPYGLPTEGNRSFLRDIGVKENKYELFHEF